MRIKSSFINQKVLQISFLILLCILPLTVTQAQTKQAQDEPFDSPTNLITCEDWINYIGETVGQWGKNKNASLIVIARLGDGESSRRINLKRIKTLKEYILVPRWKVKAVFAEGDRVKGYAIIELYIEGKLRYSLPLGLKQDVPLRVCNP